MLDHPVKYTTHPALLVKSTLNESNYYWLKVWSYKNILRILRKTALVLTSVPVSMKDQLNVYYNYFVWCIYAMVPHYITYRKEANLFCLPFKFQRFMMYLSKASCFHNITVRSWTFCTCCKRRHCKQVWID